LLALALIFSTPVISSHRGFAATDMRENACPISWLWKRCESAWQAATVHK
jgi:hypothetical protein